MIRPILLALSSKYLITRGDKTVKINYSTKGEQDTSKRKLNYQKEKLNHKTNFILKLLVHTEFRIPHRDSFLINYSPVKRRNLHIQLITPL
jgi:hypothetical protein